MPHRLNFSISLRSQPKCPICGELIIRDILTFEDSIAYCPLCGDSPLAAMVDLRRWISLDHRQGMHSQEWSTDRGFTAWTPPQHAAARTYYDRVQQLTRPEASPTPR